MPRVTGFRERREQHLHLTLAPNQRLYVNDPSKNLNFNFDHTYIITHLLAIPPTENWRPSRETKGHIVLTMGDKPQLIASHNILMSRYVALASNTPGEARLIRPIVLPMRQTLYLENNSEQSADIEILGIQTREVA